MNANLVRYDSVKLRCSVCEKEITYEETNQFWLPCLVGTDVLPLLVNVCSKECEVKLPKPPENYIPYHHKGGEDLKQPLSMLANTIIDFAKSEKERLYSTSTHSNNEFLNVDINNLEAFLNSLPHPLQKETRMLLKSIKTIQ